MTKLVPVDFDPFAGEDAPATQDTSNLKLTPVDGNPFADEDEAALVAAYNKRNPNDPVESLPDRSGILGRAQELGMGMLNAVRDQFPQDMARIARGFTGGTPGDDSYFSKVIDEQQRDMEGRLPSKQVVNMDTLAESLAQGPASIATSLATGVAGGMIGGKVGAVAGSAGGPVGAGAGATIGAMVGAGAMSGAAFYNLAKDQFLEEMYQKAQKANPNLTQDDWKALSEALDADATEFGLWEAGPEAVSQFFTAGLVKGVGGKVLSKMFPGAAGGIARVGENAIARASAKLAAEVGEEEVTEGITFMGQEGIRQRAGLREDAPTLREFANTQAGPVAVGSVLQIGGMGAAERAAAWRNNLKGGTFVDETVQQPVVIHTGKTIDLTALPSGNQFALPEGTGAIPHGTDATGIAPIPTMADMPSGPTIAMQPTLALPQTATDAPAGMWPGGRSQLSYPYGGGIRNDIAGVAPEEVMPVGGANDQHKALVAEALNSGKEVPIDVLGAYGMAYPMAQEQTLADEVAALPSMDDGDPFAPAEPAQAMAIEEQGVATDTQAVPTAAQSVAPSPSIGGFDLKPISDKAFVVTGDTKPIKDQLKAAGGKWNPKHKGWMFSNKRQAEVESMLVGVGQPTAAAPEVQNEDQGQAQAEALLAQEPTATAQEAQPASESVKKGVVGGRLSSGDVVLTSTGRKTSPFPKVDYGGERKALNTLKRVDRWLIQNAIDEAASRGDDFAKEQFQASLDNPQQADKDAAEYYLFDKDFIQKPAPRFLKTLINTVSPENVESLKRGDVVTSGDGRQFAVWDVRHGVLTAHPIVDGKPSISADTIVKFNIDDRAKARNEEYRSDTLYFSGQKAQPAQEPAPVMRQRETMNTQADEDKRLVALGQKEVPGIRLGDALDVGRVAEARDRGDVSREEWDSYVADLVASGRVTRQGDAASEAVKGTKVIAQRMDNAVRGFVDNVQEQFGFTEDEAKAVLKKFVDVKAVKLDPVMGVYKLNDGRFWDKEVMLRAIAEDDERSIQNKEQVDDGQGNQTGVVQSGQGRDDTGTARGTDGAIASGEERGNVGVSGNASEGQAGSGRIGKTANIAIKGRDDMAVRYEVVEAGDIAASHNPVAGFEKNMAYTLENERTYHSSVADRRKVLEQAQDLKPTLLMAAPDANQGAPVVDHQGNVLGGNGRAMSIEYAYEKFPEKAKAYRKGIEANAKDLGLDADAIKGMNRPVLIRRIASDLPAKERQALVSDLNASFTHNLDKKSESVTRASRISDATLRSLANVMQDADSLRKAFDSPQSRSLVEMLVKDGVIQDTERNAYIGEDGLLNPDGKSAVERAIRGRFFENYEGIKKVSGEVISKIDAAAPYLLIAENVGGDWNITDHVKAATTMAAEYKASGFDTTLAYLTTMQDMGTKPAPIDARSAEAINLFLNLVDNKVSKRAFEQSARAYANYASISEEAGGMPGIAPSSGAAFDKTFAQSVSKDMPKRKAPVVAKKVENYGEKLEGSRKDRAKTMLRELSDDDIAKQPLSKIWPADEIDKIDDKFMAAFAMAARAEIPAKPRKGYKVNAWVAQVQTMSRFVRDMLNGKFTVDAVRKNMETNTALRGFSDKVALFESIDRKDWGRIGSVNVYADAYRFEDGGKKVASPFATVEIDGKPQRFNGATSVADIVERVSAMLQGEKAASAAARDMQFEVRGSDGDVFINKAGDPEYRKLKTFGTSKEAFAYIKDNHADLVAAWEKVKERDNVTKADIRKKENRDRAGEDYRKGKDVTAEHFAKTFGFRGVEFGEWVSQGKGEKDRQGMLNQAYDALMDLANIVGVSPSAISLNGSLGLGFGSRGSGWASAHFEPGTLVINLTKTRGSGSLAHEWFHALDNYFQRERIAAGDRSRRNDGGHSGDFITYAPENYYTHDKTGVRIPQAAFDRMIEGEYVRGYGTIFKQARDRNQWTLREGVRPEVAEAFSDLVKTLDASPMAKRSSIIDKGKSGYWSRIIERAARAFENYVMAKMSERGFSNDYLANVVSIDEFRRNADRYPYLMPDEVAPVAKSFDALFSTLQERKTDKGTALYFRPQYARGENTSGLDAKEVTSLAKPLLDLLTDSTKVNIVQSVADLPEGLRKKMVRDKAENVLGAFYGGTNYLIADNIPTAEDVMFVLKHELFHDGMRRMRERYASKYGRDEAVKRMNHFLDLAFAANKESIMKLANAYRQDFPDLSDANNRRGLTEEWLGNRAYDNAPKWFDRYVAAIRRFIRDVANRLGVKLQFSDAELRDFIRRVQAETGDYGGDGGGAYLRAFHGSPHRFDKFTLGAIGTGEGAQAFGWGLYFAGKKEVAEWYREELTRVRMKPREARVLVDGEPIGSVLGLTDLTSVMKAKVLTALDIADGDISKAEFGLREQIRGAEDLSGPLPSLREKYAPAFSFLESLRGKNVTIDRTREVGQLYEVDIPEDDVMLHWDKPLSEQPEKVRAALARIEEELGWSGSALKSPVGRDLYRHMEVMVSAEDLSGNRPGGVSQAVSEILNDYGIKGIKYLDGTSRADGDGSYNYVIFDDAAVEIAKTYYARPEEVSAAGATSPAEVAEAQRMWAEMGTESPYFKKWFGDSKVVDEQGKPLVVYHGTRADFEAFDPGKWSKNTGADLSILGVYFTEDPLLAGDFSRGKSWHKKGKDKVGSRVIPAYLSIKNPKLLTGKEWTNLNGRSVLSLRDYKEQLQHEGYDGIVVSAWEGKDPTGELHVPQYIAFSPTQIKSVFNRGTFDANDPRILYSRPEGMPSAQDVAKVIDGFETGDIGELGPLLRLPHWLAKKVPSLRSVVDRQFEREERRSSSLSQSIESIPELFGGDRIKGKDRKQLLDFLWKWDGKNVKMLDETPKFVVAEQRGNRLLLKKNEEWDKTYAEWVESEGLTGQVAAAAISVRKALDDAFVRGYNRLALMAETPDTMLEEMRSLFMHLDNYMPHSRTGTYGVAVYDKDGEALYREHFDAPSKAVAKIRADKRLKELRKEFPQAARFWAGVNKGMPEEIYEQFLSMDAMEKMLFAAVDNAVDDKAVAADLKKGITMAASDEFKSRGWLSHSIGRKNVPGFERENVERVLFDYFAGHHGFLEKVDAARDMASALKKIDPKTRPNEHAYVVQYVKDMLRNSDKIDLVVGNIKALAFVWYLGGVMKTAAVNATQNIVSGAPTLGLWTKGSSHVRIFDAAMRSVVKGRLSEDEQRLVKELHENGLTQANLIREVQGRVSGKFGSVGNRVISALGWPMAAAERFNRVSLALAAYRAARSGALNDKARSEFGIAGKADHEEAKSFAESIVRDAHFVYGKSNLPQPLRSSKAGRVASAAYTFRSFNHNMLEMWANALVRHGWKDGGKAVLSSMAGTMVLGGLRAAPFFATSMALMNWLAPMFGGTGDDDWLEKIAKMLPKAEWMRDIILFGVPSLAGVDIGGSLRLEAPMVDRSAKYRHGDILGDMVGEALGIPYALVQSVGRAKSAVEAGAPARAVEEIAPVALKNAMAAYRLATEGAHSITGTPIKDPLTQQPKTLSSTEAVFKALGFQAVSQTKASLTQNAVDRTDAVRADKAKLLANRIANAMRDNNVDAVKANLRAWKDWNAKAKADDKPSLLILPKDMKARLRARLAERKTSPRQALRIMQMIDAYGK